MKKMNKISSNNHKKNTEVCECQEKDITLYRILINAN